MPTLKLDPKGVHARSDKTRYPTTYIAPDIETCPDCGGQLKEHTYTIKQRDIKTNVLLEVVKRTYLQCRKCSRKYDPMVQDEW